MLIGRRAGLGIAGAAIYVALASWAKFSYVAPEPKAARAFQLYRPFIWETGFAWRVGQLLHEDVSRLTEDILVYEDGHALDRADNFQEVSTVPGRFLYDRGVILFSTRGDPNHNGRTYWAAVPDK